ncbi:uncharacterized protein LOC109849802 [Asparagus officinalis]|uniref:uncharacterized protein LOC109849802 n=1 Tax=Asparagus officinalis TaxID=4686 RepID=UPI00098E55A8|nr:uncharacterized protein LOC109849802 [Asparagus officinalis]
MPWAAAIRRCERLGGRPGLNGPITRAASKFHPKKALWALPRTRTQKQNPKPKTQNPNSKVKKSIPKSLTVSPTPPAKGKKSKIVFVASISCWPLAFRALLQPRAGLSSSSSISCWSFVFDLNPSSVSCWSFVFDLRQNPSSISCWTFELAFNLVLDFRARLQPGSSFSSSSFSSPTSSSSISSSCWTCVLIFNLCGLLDFLACV